MRRPDSNINLGVLVDIISNVAGMMILLACVAVMIRQRSALAEQRRRPGKSTSFPLAYVPDKRSLTLCLKHKRLYCLPETAALRALSARTERGETVKWLTLTQDGVEARLDLTSTCTGFRFQYRLLPGGGVELRAKVEVAATLEALLEANPPAHFFYVIHTWPDSFEEFREIRAFLLERGVEVGWQPRPWPMPGTDEADAYDVSYSMGEYADNLSTIKAQ